MSGRERQTTGGGRFKRLAGFLGSAAWGLLLVLLLLYGLVQIGVRTECFRLRMEKELSRRLGMEMRVGRIRATESLNLKIRDVISVSEEAGLEARLIRVRWRLFRPRGAPLLESVRVDGWAVTFAPDDAGVMQPAVLGDLQGRISGWVGLGPAGMGLPSPRQKAVPAAEADGLFRPGVSRIDLRRGTLRLQDRQGRLQAAAEDLHVRLNSLLLPEGGRVSHLDLKAGVVQIASGPRIIGLHLEVVDTGDRQMVSVLEATDWGGAPRPRSSAAEYRKLLDAMDD
ncbi:MAG: hypothetical protein GX548_06420 [Lentisphaerae bacterium]|nr:hypothetical protein [Lentisphaerota bacterium]